MAIGDGFGRVLAGAQASDERALEVLYRDLAPLVLGYLRGRGAADPEDLTSETFVAVVRNLGRFRGDETKFRSWVLTIAHRRLIDARRRVARRPESLLEPEKVAETVGGTAVDAAVEAFDRLGEERMLRLLAGLTDDQRAVVLLRVVADLPVNEVANIVGKRPGAVKTLQRRALARLARLLDVPGETGETGEGDEPPGPLSGPFPGDVPER